LQPPVRDVPLFEQALVRHDDLVVEALGFEMLVHQALFVAEHDRADTGNTGTDLDDLGLGTRWKCIEATTGLGTGPHDAHVTDEHIPELGKFIQLRPAEEAPEWKHPRIVLQRDRAGAHVRAVLQHGGELEQPERLPLEPYALLDEEDLALAGAPQD